MRKYLKVKKLWNLVVSKPEPHNLRLKNLVKTNFEVSRNKEHSLIADTKLQVDQIKKLSKVQQAIFYLKIKYFKIQNDHKLSSNQLDYLTWRKLRSQ